MSTEEAVGWAYWLDDHWHLCADEPVAHPTRRRVWLVDEGERASLSAALEAQDLWGAKIQTAVLQRDWPALDALCFAPARAYRRTQ